MSVTRESTSSSDLLVALGTAPAAQEEGVLSGDGPTPPVPRSYLAPGSDGIAHGTLADESIFATADGQTLIGGGGNDIFHIGTHTGLTLEENRPGTSEVATYLPNYTLPAPIDNLIGQGDYAHRLTGNEGDNFIIGAGGDDVINGADGNDAIEGRGGADRLDGGNGLDIALYTHSPASVTVDLATGTGHGGDAEGDTLANFEGVRGSPFADHLIGGPGNDELEGGGGNDDIRGGGGNDILISGERSFGEVTLTAAHFTFGELSPVDRDGVVRLDGGPGDDTLIGGAHTTYFIHAGNGSDTVLNYVPGGVVDLDGYAIGDKATLLSHGTFGFGSASFDLGNGEKLTFLLGPHPPPLTPSFFDTVTFSFTNVAGGGIPSGEGPTPTPSVPRSYLAPGSDGVAHGTPAAESIFATADGQTLIGGGGNDVFHIGTHTGLTLEESKPGISEVATYLPTYTLPAPIDNLVGQGDYAHRLTGNAGNNVITGAAGDDTINGAGGTDLLIGDGGHDTFVIDATRRHEILTANAPHVADFDPASDVLDMRGYVAAAGLGSDPFGTGKLALAANHAGGTDIVDNTQNISAGGAPIPEPVITLDHVAAASLHPSDFLLV